MQLDYRLSPSSNRESDVRSWAGVSEMDLRYDLYLGDVVFLVDGVDFSALWGWVPLLDFATGLDRLAAEVSCDGGPGEVSLEFTESDATITFRRRGGEIEVEASYVPGVARVASAELGAAVRAFAVRVLDDVRAAHPEVAGNAAFVAMSRLGGSL